MKLTDIRVEVTEEALQAAMKEAVASGLIRGGVVPPEEYLRLWGAMRQVLEASVPHMGLVDTAWLSGKS